MSAPPRSDESNVRNLRALSPCHRHNLESFKCCRFDVENKNSVYQYEPVEARRKNCVDVDTTGNKALASFAGWTYCPKNMVLAGMFRDDYDIQEGDVDDWSAIDKIWCCEITGKKRALRYGSLPTEVVTDKKDVAGCSEACSGYQFMALSDTGACTCDNEWPSVTKYGSVSKTLTYPDVACPDGYKEVLDPYECAGLAQQNGNFEWYGELNDDPNWIHGCFNW